VTLKALQWLCSIQMHSSRLQSSSHFTYPDHVGWLSQVCKAQVVCIMTKMTKFNGTAVFVHWLNCIWVDKDTLLTLTDKLVSNRSWNGTIQRNCQLDLTRMLATFREMLYTHIRHSSYIRLWRHAPEHQGLMVQGDKIQRVEYKFFVTSQSDFFSTYC
jgi:hypothetical protein